ncbi:MAG TPA: quinone-dependent dihydroorotate dehydrogenase [Propionibacteriaceae bacterium]
MILDLGYRRVLRPLVFRAGSGDPEQVHEQTLDLIHRVGDSRVARNVVSAFCVGRQHPVTVAGIEFPSVVGLAAGMDKNGVGLRAWAALGFGHVELGTVTARAQPGNDRPRVFRLKSSQGVINRMGFNNQGAPALADTLEAAGVVRGNGAVGLPLGISIGKTKLTPIAEATEDYLTSLRLLAGHADYVAVNVSSPNTPGLRTLQDADTLRELVSALVTESRVLAGGGTPVPIFVKVAPDLTESALEEVIGVCTESGAQGLIATNTTLGRDGLAAPDAWKSTQAGGLSGAPLTLRAREVVAFLAARTDLPIIGVGGIMTRDDGVAMLDAGASLIQLYTGYIYGGPGLVKALSRLEGASA